MWKRAATIGALVIAIAATTAWPTYAAQGRRRPAATQKNKVKPAKQARSNKSAKTAKGKPATTSKVNDDQRARLRGMLPPGMTVEQAASGFENHGQFVAAVNASHLHRVSFVQLKHLMVNQGMTLGQALKSLRPDLGDLDANGNRRSPR